MRKGFFTPSAGAAGKQLQPTAPFKSAPPDALSPQVTAAGPSHSRDDRANAAAVAAADAPPAKTSPSSAVPAPAVAAMSEEQRAAATEHCLGLLRGPSDERRFAGLLLITRLLPVGDDDLTRRVYRAVGPTFLARLLLPLRTRRAGDTTSAPTSGTTTSTSPPTPSQAPGGGAAPREQQLASVGLGLALLAAVSRVPDLAAEKGLADKMQLLMRVARAGGISRLLAPRQEAVSPSTTAAPPLSSFPVEGATEAGPATTDVDRTADVDRSAVCDSLEATAALADACGAPGCWAALRDGVLPAATAVLKASRGDVEVEAHAVALLNSVLSGLQDRPGALEGCVAEVAQVVPPLSSVFGRPARQQPKGKAPEGGGSGAAAGGGQGGGREAPKQDMYSLQLSALRVLQLLLADLTPSAQQALELALLSEEEEEVGSSGRISDGGWWRWASDIRDGLGLLLRSRVGAAQRFGALRLAAALVSLVGPQWLLEQGGGAFFQALVEVTRVEASVLLHDVIAPGLSVPSTHADAASAAAWRPPEPRSVLLGNGGSDGEEDEEGEGVMEVDTAGVGDGDEGPATGEGEEGVGGRRRGQDPAEMRALEEALRTGRVPGSSGGSSVGGASGSSGSGGGGVSGRGVAAGAPGAAGSDGGGSGAGAYTTSGARAGAMLPVVYALMEAQVEALAREESRGEDPLADPPELQPRAASQCLASLQEATGTVLQFLGQTAAAAGLGGQKDAAGGLSGGSEEGGGVSGGTAGSGVASSTSDAGDGGQGGSDAAARAVHDPQVLAATRVVGRFLAELPQALGPEVRQALPLMMAADGGDKAGGPMGVQFLAPGLEQATNLDLQDPGGSSGREDLLSVLAEPACTAPLAARLQHLAYTALAQRQRQQQALEQRRAGPRGGRQQRQQEVVEQDEEAHAIEGQLALLCLLSSRVVAWPGSSAAAARRHQQGDSTSNSPAAVALRACAAPLLEWARLAAAPSLPPISPSCDRRSARPVGEGLEACGSVLLAAQLAAALLLQHRGSRSEVEAEGATEAEVKGAAEKDVGAAAEEEGGGGGGGGLQQQGASWREAASQLLLLGLRLGRAAAACGPDELLGMMEEGGEGDAVVELALLVAADWRRLAAAAERLLRQQEDAGADGGCGGDIVFARVAAADPWVQREAMASPREAGGPQWASFLAAYEMAVRNSGCGA